MFWNVEKFLRTKQSSENIQKYTISFLDHICWLFLCWYHGVFALFYVERLICNNTFDQLYADRQHNKGR